ncbi:hypothetical protein KL86DPRO_10435 [uncultured delta proteobacterium]|uniref:HTH cro/C1-type domain-containing protein n=1 Tax=uncultured delta proteobacterium TaxID=34034 RepID=A0A212J0J4_9DELT|nr:hypothetical protein KL86DPRO_10435 [uncultured delta proteobacterium]
MRNIPEFRRAFGYVLRQRRELAGLTQPELAVRIGGSEINIRTLERSASAPSMVTFLLLADALDVDPHDMLGDVLARIAFLRGSGEAS